MSRSNGPPEGADFPGTTFSQNLDFGDNEVRVPTTEDSEVEGNETVVLTIEGDSATGTGALGWWLQCAPRPWSELEGLTDELTAEHLAVVATESEGVRVIGGAPAVPTRALAESTVRAAASLA